MLLLSKSIKMHLKKSYFEFLTMQSFTQKKQQNFAALKVPQQQYFVHFSFRKKTTKKAVFKITSQLFVSKSHLKCPLGIDKSVCTIPNKFYYQPYKIDTKFCHSSSQDEPTKCNLIKKHKHLLINYSYLCSVLI